MSDEKLITAIENGFEEGGYKIGEIQKFDNKSVTSAFAQKKSALRREQEEEIKLAKKNLDLYSLDLDDKRSLVEIEERLGPGVWLGEEIANPERARQAEELAIKDEKERYGAVLKEMRAGGEALSEEEQKKRLHEFTKKMDKLEEDYRESLTLGPEERNQRLKSRLASIQEEQRAAEERFKEAQGQFEAKYPKAAESTQAIENQIAGLAQREQRCIAKLEQKQSELKRQDEILEEIGMKIHQLEVYAAPLFYQPCDPGKDRELSEVTGDVTDEFKYNPTSRAIGEKLQNMTSALSKKLEACKDPLLSIEQREQAIQAFNKELKNQTEANSDTLKLESHYKLPEIIKQIVNGLNELTGGRFSVFSTRPQELMQEAKEMTQKAMRPGPK